MICKNNENNILYYTRLYTRNSGSLNVGKNQSFEKNRFSFEEQKKKVIN